MILEGNAFSLLEGAQALQKDEMEGIKALHVVGSPFLCQPGGSMISEGKD